MRMRIFPASACVVKFFEDMLNTCVHYVWEAGYFVISGIKMNTTFPQLVREMFHRGRVVRSTVKSEMTDLNQLRACRTI